MTNFNEVYITRISTFLPNQPIGNDEIEQILGFAGGRPSRSRAIILRSNGIKRRYYALDSNGNFRYSNAEMVARAIEGLFDEDIPQSKMEVLACGTSSPDMLLPSLASMVHGELNAPALDIISAAGACCTGIQALKYAYYAIVTGEAETAVATGSERVSQYLQGKKFDLEMEDMKALEDNPILAFEKDFLRWMLSDGAGAFLLRNKPQPGSINFKIEWIEIGSYADQLDTCMYLGADRNGTARLRSFGEMEVDDWGKRSVFSYKQDVRALGDNIVPFGVKFLKSVLSKRKIDTTEIDYFLPHLSSMFFWKKIVEEFDKEGVDIPESKWFINLPEVGNIGAASAYAMLQGLTERKDLVKGNKVMLFVPESARFSYAVVYLTVC